MDKDVLMFLIGGVAAVIFFVALPTLIAALSRFDHRAEDAEHLGPDDFLESDLNGLSGEVQAALVEFSVKHISQEEFNDVLMKARTQ